MFLRFSYGHFEIKSEFLVYFLKLNFSDTTPVSKSVKFLSCL